jgi:hypothetical protein
MFGFVRTSIDIHSEHVRHQIATSAIAHELRAPITGNDCYLSIIMLFTLSDYLINRHTMRRYHWNGSGIY